MTGNNYTFPTIGMARHRIGIDGYGVTTLVCAYGCPLRCKMCLNPHSFRENTKIQRYTVEELYDTVKIDNLYFMATGGGITFGGGEPLIYAEFINEFARMCKPEWKINIETSLNVAEEKAALAALSADMFIVDIKDMNPHIYKAYTGLYNDSVINNLNLLLDIAGPDKILARVPLIKNYNTVSDCDKSEEILRKMGITHIDRFEYVEVNK